MGDKIDHLQMLQAVIDRMGGNSFLLKGWSVTLVSALLALAADKGNPRFALLGLLPVIMFWALDAYFLHQERIFRALFDEVRQQDASRIDFSMDTRSVATQVASYARVSASLTLVLFHGVLLATVVLVIYLLPVAHG